MPSCRLIHLTLWVLALGFRLTVEAQGAGGWPLHGLDLALRDETR